ncbi:hypothetical protein B0H21DRAFT_164691 [Amylocystis lapponica]|nr:hypothetical protein B0H21DRAFT_164691 [Amylocystis lapponica]
MMIPFSCWCVQPGLGLVSQSLLLLLSHAPQRYLESLWPVPNWVCTPSFVRRWILMCNYSESDSLLVSYVARCRGDTDV